jgi:hypothetical protein
LQPLLVLQPNNEVKEDPDVVVVVMLYVLLQTLKSSSKGGSVESDTDDIRGPAARDNSHGGAPVTAAPAVAIGAP